MIQHLTKKISFRMVFLLIFLSLFAPQISDASLSLKGLYNKGKRCEYRLKTSKKKRLFRHNWERCIKLYGMITKKYPDSRLVEKSIYNIAELYKGLYKYSQRSKDKKRAELYYKKLINRYPDGNLAERARSILRSLHRGNKRAGSMVKKIRYWSHPDYTRVVIDLEDRVRFKHNRVVKRRRLYIDLYNTYISSSLKGKTIVIDDGVIKTIDSIQHSPDKVRVVLDIESINDYKIFTLPNPHRVVIDLYGNNKITKEIDIYKDSKEEKPELRESAPPQFIYKSAAEKQNGINTIVIDPGHGGKDPGAIGRTGLREKDVVLDIAIRLKKLIENKLHKDVILTRKQDVFVSLEDRTLIANNNNADLFISIHVNSSPRRNIHGVEIFLLGRSSDKKSMNTAIRENNSDPNEMNDLEKILIDLLQTAKTNESLEFAYIIKDSFVDTLGKIYDIKDLGVKRAPFYVLINAEMTSILAEVSFISNIIEEKRLKKSDYRQKIVESLFVGIKRYINGRI
ncbi:MAG: N-acetylmuramoyl-L-alanine amidase [Nitrospirota bacterium]